MKQFNSTAVVTAALSAAVRAVPAVGNASSPASPEYIFVVIGHSFLPLAPLKRNKGKLGARSLQQSLKRKRNA